MQAKQQRILEETHTKLTSQGCIWHMDKFSIHTVFMMAKMKSVEKSLLKKIVIENNVERATLK